MKKERFLSPAKNVVGNRNATFSQLESPWLGMCRLNLPTFWDGQFGPLFVVPATTCSIVDKTRFPDRCTRNNFTNNFRNHSLIPTMIRIIAFQFFFQNGNQINLRNVQKSLCNHHICIEGNEINEYFLLLNRLISFENLVTPLFWSIVDEATLGMFTSMVTEWASSLPFQVWRHWSIAIDDRCRQPSIAVESIDIRWSRPTWCQRSALDDASVGSRRDVRRREKERNKKPAK